MIDDLSKTIKAQLYERINSPLLGSFILSWATWNYKFIVVLFSAMSVEMTFAYIDQTLYSTWLYASWMLLIGPAITAALIIFVYPYPAKFVYEYARKRQNELKVIQQKIDDETPLTKEEAKEIRSSAFKQAIELEARLQQREQEITRLRLENEALQERISRPKLKDLDALKIQGIKTTTPNDQQKKTKELTKEQAQMLLGVSKNNGRSGTRAFLENLLGSEVKNQYDRDKLVEYDYISDAYDRISVTNKGRAYLVENGMV